jgi:hypothetical protein
MALPNAETAKALHALLEKNIEYLQYSLGLVRDKLSSRDSHGSTAGAVRLPENGRPAGSFVSYHLRLAFLRERILDPLMRASGGLHATGPPQPDAPVAHCPQLDNEIGSKEIHVSPEDGSRLSQ